LERSWTDRLSQARGIIWDLDNTLYRLNDALAQAFHFAVARAALEGGVKMQLEEAAKIAQKSFADFGYSGRVFVRDHGIDDVWLHHKFHHYINETVIEKSAELVDLFAQSDLRHALITHGSGHWARRVLLHLGLKDYFPDDAILALEDYGFQKKSDSPASFIRALDALKLEPEQVLFVEDTAKNLAIAYELGLTTVLLHYDSKPNPMPPYVHFDCDNAMTLLRQIAQHKNAVNLK
jgi:pyrimidine 5'-nucleotidase